MTSAEILMLILTFVMAVGTLISAVVMMSNKKQRNEVSFSFEPASKKEFDEARLKRDAEIEKVYALIEHNRETAEQARKKSAAGIYDKIDEVEQRVLDRVDTKIDEMKETIRVLPNELVTMLRNTGTIGKHESHS